MYISSSSCELLKILAVLQNKDERYLFVSFIPHQFSIVIVTDPNRRNEVRVNSINKKI